MSFLSESVTLGLAVRSIRRSARKESMTFTEFVLSGYDPCVNVVLLEVGSHWILLMMRCDDYYQCCYIQDAAAVAGVVIAATAMGLSHASGSHIPDAVRRL